MRKIDDAIEAIIKASEYNRLKAIEESAKAVCLAYHFVSMPRPMSDEQLELVNSIAALSMKINT